MKHEAPRLLRTVAVYQSYLLLVLVCLINNAQAVGITNWTVSHVGHSDAIDRAHYVNGRYLLSGEDYAYFSFDGLSWSRSKLDENFRSGGIIYGEGKYLMAGSVYSFDSNLWESAIYCSLDGRTWSRGVIPAGNELNDLSYGAGRFIAVADGGQTFYSTDGVEWLAGGNAGSVDLSCVVYGGGVFMTAGENKLYTSVDGVVWTDRSSAIGLQAYHVIRCLHFNDGKFYLAGWYTGVRTSTSLGQNWQQASMPNGKNYDIRSMASSGSDFIAIGDDRADSSAAMLISVGGLSWQEATPTGLQVTDSVIYGNGRYLSTQGAGGVQYSDLLDASNSSPTVSINLASSGVARAVMGCYGNANDADGDELFYLWDFKDGTPLKQGEFISHRFLTGGTRVLDLWVSDGNGGVNRAQVSVTITDPLDNWIKLTTQTSGEFNDITSGGGRLVAVGSGPTAFGSGLYSVSTDGSTWSTNELGSYITFEAIVYDGAKFIAVGKDFSTELGAYRGVIYSSTDGSSWLLRHSGGEPLQDVTHGGGLSVASGNAGTILKSTDGENWSSLTSGVSQNLNGITYGNGKFVIVGADSESINPVVLSSIDGQNWVDQSGGCGTPQGFYTVEFCHDRFLASGYLTQLRYSEDGAQSFSSSRLLREKTLAMSYGNGVYFAAGVNQDDGDSDTKLVSIDGVHWGKLNTVDQSDRNGAVFYNNRFFTVGIGGNIWKSGEINAVTTWAEWRATQFPSLPARSDWNEDYDNDGILNIVEYALGLDPTSVSHLFQLNEELGFMTASVNKFVGASDVYLQIEASSNLEDWSSANLSTLLDTDGQLKVRINTMTSEELGSKKFFRLKVGYR